MLSAKLAIDIVFIALVVIAISITAVVVAAAITGAFSGIYLVEQSAQMEESSEASRLTVTEQDSESQQDEDQVFEFMFTHEMAAHDPAGQLAAAVYGSSPFLLPITWGAVAGTLIWRGKVRSAWSRQGYDYDTFKLVAKMRGSPMRIRLLNAVSGGPKNKLQLAKELEVDWKTVDNHVEMLLQGRLVQERTVVGTARYYAITHDGMKVLSLLSGSEMGGDKVGNN